MLFIGEKVGGGGSQQIDVALDPLEGTTLCAKAMPNSIAVIAMADTGSLLHAPDTYMDKIAIGGGYPEGTVDLDAPPQDNIKALAKAKGVRPSGITACILDRPRHAELIAAVRETGAAVTLITDGDVAGVIHTTDPDTGIDIYMGIGGAPEGVLAAAALRCTGGQMQGRLQTQEQRAAGAGRKMGIKDFDRKLDAPRHGVGRRHLRGERRHRRLHAARRTLRQAVDRDGNGCHALGDGYDTVDPEPQEDRGRSPRLTEAIFSTCRAR